MIQILTLIQFAFPFLLLTAFFCLYRKEYGFMKQFMWKMAMFQSARNLYAYLVVLMLIFINWCCHVTAPNLSVVVSILLTLVLLNRKIAESTFHFLNESFSLNTIRDITITKKGDVYNRIAATDNEVNVIV